MSDFHLADVLREHAADRPDAPAVTCGEHRLTYRELDRLSNAVAAKLSDLGAGPGARIAHLDRNALESPVLLFAAAKLGAVLVPLNWRLAKSELETVVEDSGAEILIVGPGFEGDGLAEHVVEAATLRDLEPADDAPGGPADPSEPVLQLYTSGTTGKPKGVLISNDNMSAVGEDVADFWGVDDSSVSLVAMPLFHIGGIGWMVVGLASGAENVLIPEIDPAALVETMESEGVTNAFLVPTVLQMLCGVDGVTDRDWSKLRSIAYGASPITTKVLKTVLKTFEAPLFQVYGLTETTGAIVQLAADDHDREELLQSAGKPYPWIELRIVDTESGDDCDSGDVGEVWVRGVAITSGYHERPDETEAALTDDGWFRTGDGGYVDDEGYLFLTDRIKDMIVTGAENVYPVEVEDVLSGHDAVAEVAVIGLPDEQWGEVVTAIVVPDGDAPDLDALKAFAREKLAGYKVPKKLICVDELPKTATGKVLKKDLREQYAD